MDERMNILHSKIDFPKYNERCRKIIGGAESNNPNNSFKDWCLRVYRKSIIVQGFSLSFIKFNIKNIRNRKFNSESQSNYTLWNFNFET